MRHIILTIGLLLGVLAARAENIVSVSSVSGHPQEEVTLSVSLANTDAAVAFQAEIPLGSQLTYVPGSVALNPDRITDHQVTAAVVNGNLRIYAYSLSLTPFSGTEGTLLSFALKLKNEPGDYPLDISNSILSSSSSTSIPLTLQPGQVTILSPKLQLNTPTINFGHVPIRSEYTQNASVTNVGNEPLTITGITFSNAVFSCPSFTETTLQPGNSTSFAFKFAPMLKGAVTATATIASNTSAGNTTVALMADPFAVNEIHINNVSGYCDSIVEVPISMNNMEDITGFQIDMNLPQALEYVDFTLSDRKTDHTALGVFNEGTLRLIAYSGSGAAFTGVDGVIGTLRLRLHGQYGNYYLNPTKAVLADANGENVLSDQYQGYVNIRSPRINGDNTCNFGSSPVTETVVREYVVSNAGNAPMRLDQVVFDQPGFSVAETFPIILEQGTATTLHVSCNREQDGNFSAIMKIYSNDPLNGLKNVTIQGRRYEPNDVMLAVDPFSLGNGDVAVALSMNNHSGIVAMQADFVYPYRDYTVAQVDFVKSERLGNHTFYAVPINDSTYRVMAFSMTNSPVPGQNGVVLNVTLHPKATPSEEEYRVEVSQIVLSAADGTNAFTGQNISVGFSLASATQTFELVEGWNWWTPTVYVTVEQLEEALGQDNLTVASQSSGTTSLQSVIPGQMYKIQANKASTVDLPGRAVASATIGINPGRTWFGYLGADKPIAQALPDFHPAIGDAINSQEEGFAIYDVNGWSGTLTTLKNGHGYEYHSTASITKALTFGASYSNGSSSYTAVDYIWAEKQTSSVYESTRIDTEIKLGNISKVRCRMKPIAYTGDVWIGNFSNDSQDFRLFATSLSSSYAYTYFDFKYSRSNSSNYNFREDTEVDVTIEVTSSDVYVYLTDGGSTSNYMYRNSTDGTLEDLNYLAVINCIKLGILQIWDASGVLVKDLRAALDNEGTPCMYDEVNKEFVYKSGVDRTMYYESSEKHRSIERHYAPDAHAKNANTPIVAKVLIDSVTPENLANLEVGAFVNGSLRGSALVSTNLDNTYWIQAYHNESFSSDAWQDDNDTIEFKLFDHSKGVEYSICSTTVMASSDGVGTLAEPIELQFSSVVSHSSTLATGWYWWSTYIEQEGIIGLSMLEEGLGEAGEMIKSMTAYARPKPNHTWYGSLKSLNNETGYKIQVSADCAPVMAGALADPADHPITIGHGWNWIGYPVTSEQSVNAALAGITPTDKDVIKWQTGYARYDANSGTWKPSSFKLVPGRAYLYQSNATEDKTLVFAQVREEPEESPRECHWTNDIHAFPDNASVLAVVSVDGEEVCGETVELGAFVNGECRGSVRLEYDMDYGRCYAWLTVTATDGEEVGFRMYDEATGETSLNSTTRMTFQADAVVGDFDTPLVLDFAKAQGTSPSPTLKAYPNPVHRNEAIALQLPNGTTVTEVVVTDILGRTICRETANATILKGIPEPGVYNLEIRTEDGNLHHGKIIVN